MYMMKSFGSVNLFLSAGIWGSEFSLRVLDVYHRQIKPVTSTWETRFMAPVLLEKEL